MQTIPRPGSSGDTSADDAESDTASDEDEAPPPAKKSKKVIRLIDDARCIIVSILATWE